MSFTSITIGTSPGCCGGALSEVPNVSGVGCSATSDARSPVDSHICALRASCAATTATVAATAASTNQHDAIVNLITISPRGQGPNCAPHRTSFVHALATTVPAERTIF